MADSAHTPKPPAAHKSAAPPPPAKTALPPPPAAPPAAPPAPASTAAVDPTLGNGVTGLMQNFSLTMELQGLIGQGQIEQAFAVALSAKNVEIIMWLCGKLEPKALAGPPPVSQIILMSLITQLSDNLESEPAIKLTWLRETLAMLNPKDPLIAPNVQRILSSAGQKLQVAPRRGYNPSPGPCVALVLTSPGSHGILMLTSPGPYVPFVLTSPGAHVITLWQAFSQQHGDDVEPQVLTSPGPRA